MFKDTYSKQLELYEKFWNREPMKRPVLNAGCYREIETILPPKDLNQKWFDHNYRIYSYNKGLKNIYLAAESVPMLFTNFGPGCLAACVGGSYTLAENTVWFERKPIINDWDGRKSIRFDPESEMWGYLKALMQKAAEDPEICFSFTDIGGIMDVAGSLRGTQTLLYDLYDDPERVKELLYEIEQAWYEMFDLQKEAISSAGIPYNGWMNIPSETPWFPLQDDFCAMISPSQFEEFALPHLTRQTEYMDRSIYHLDGPGEIPHLDMLLDIPTLNGIQWISGDAHEPLYDEKWFPMYRKIQDKKKNLVLMDAISENHLKGAEALIKSIDPIGTYITIGASSPERIEYIVELVEKWSQ